jgi:hypothetical protein
MGLLDLLATRRGVSVVQAISETWLTWRTHAVSRHDDREFCAYDHGIYRTLLPARQP